MFVSGVGWTETQSGTTREVAGLGRRIYQFAVEPYPQTIADGNVLWEGFGFGGNTHIFIRSHPGCKLSELTLQQATRTVCKF